MMTLKLALRGLWRHKVRTIITLSAVSLMHCWGLVFVGFNDGGHELMIEMGVRQGRAGHVVVQAEGYQKTQSVELLVPNPEVLRARVKKAAPAVKIALRAFGSGLAKTADDAVGIMFSGVEPQEERQVNDIVKKLIRGVYFSPSEATIRKAEKALVKARKKAAKKRKGKRKAAASSAPVRPALWCARKPASGDPVYPQVVVGSLLAKNLKVDICDKLVIQMQGLGSREEAKFVVTGIFEFSSPDLDGSFVNLRLSDVQRMLHIGKGVHQVAIFAKNAKATKPTLKKVKGVIKDPALVVLPWDKALPELAEFIWLDEASGYVFLLIVYLIIWIGVLNTMLMSVMERTREFGVMRALGAGPLRIFGLVLVEGAFIGLLAIMIGGILGAPWLYLAETHGIPVKWMTGEASMEAGGLIIDVIYSKLYFWAAFNSCLAVLGMCVAAAIYPAFRAARLQVLKAIHHV